MILELTKVVIIIIGKHDIFLGFWLIVCRVILEAIKILCPKKCCNRDDNKLFPLYGGKISHES